MGLFQTKAMLKPNDEKLAFSTRLKASLKRSKKKIESPTDLALQFNLRYTNSSITIQAAQKWLSGKSIPTPDKIETLAQWLNVSVRWLRYGFPEAKPNSASPVKLSNHAATNRDALSNSEKELLRRIRCLPEVRRQLIEEIVEQFSLEQEMWLDK